MHWWKEEKFITNAVYNLGYGVTNFSMFLQIELVTYVSIIK